VYKVSMKLKAGNKKYEYKPRSLEKPTKEKLKKCPKKMLKN